GGSAGRARRQADAASARSCARPAAGRARAPLGEDLVVDALRGGGAEVPSKHPVDPLAVRAAELLSEIGLRGQTQHAADERLAVSWIADEAAFPVAQELGQRAPVGDDRRKSA